MRISPREILVTNGEDEFIFKIKNSPREDRLLLFKVRRSDPKLVDFAPKAGIIEPGATQAVTIKLVHPNVTYAKVLVKLVVIERSRLHQDFAVSWAAGANRGGEEGSVVKKTVHIRNMLFSSHAPSEISLSEDSEDDREVDRDFSEMHKHISSAAVDGEIGPEKKLAPASLSSHGDASQLKPEAFKSGVVAATAAAAAPPQSGAGAEASDEVVPRREKSEVEAKSDAQAHLMDLIPAELSELMGPSEKRSVLIGVGLGVSMGLALSPNKPSRSTDTPVVSSPSASSVIGGSVPGNAIQEALSKLAEQETQLRRVLGTSQVPDPVFPLQVFTTESVGTASPSRTSAFQSVHSSPHGKPPVTVSPHSSVLLEAINMEAQQCSSVRQLMSESSFVGKDLGSSLDFNGSASGPKNVLVTVSGSSVTDSVARLALELRVAAVSDARGSVVSIELTDSPNVRSLTATLGAVFLSEVSHDAAVDRLCAMQALLLETSLRHLCVSRTSIQSFDTSLNRFQSLTHLDLSHNRIHNIQPNLGLASLKMLNLSSNFLQGLDFLQPLHQLRRLDVSNNRLQSLHTSVFQLVPLSANIQSIDLSNNAICLDHMYADSVLSILPKLVFFDKRDLRKYVEGYKAAGIHSKSKPSPRAAPGLPLLPVELGSSVLGGSNQKDRAAADVRLDQQLRRAMQKKPVEARTKFLSSDVDEDLELTQTRPSHAKVEASHAQSSDYVAFSPQRISSSIKPPTQSSSPTSSRSSSLRTGPESALKLTASARRRRNSSGFTSMSVDAALAVTQSSEMNVETEGDGYNSDGNNRHKGTNRAAEKHRRELARRAPHVLEEMQEDPRFSSWNPRYRIPKPVYGLSKPFSQRPAPKPVPTENIPMFEETVTKMRDSFEKMPIRGTLSLAPRGLLPGFYPMDFEEVEALRRSGRFNDTIGIVHHAPEISKTANKSQHPGRRKAPTSHTSRQYQDWDQKVAEPEDSFAAHKKWHPYLYEYQDPVASTFLASDLISLNSSVNKSQTANSKIFGQDMEVDRSDGERGQRGSPEEGVEANDESVFPEYVHHYGDNVWEDYPGVQSVDLGSGAAPPPESNLSRIWALANDSVQDDSVVGNEEDRYVQAVLARASARAMNAMRRSDGGVRSQSHFDAMSSEMQSQPSAAPALPTANPNSPAAVLSRAAALRAKAEARVTEEEQQLATYLNWLDEQQSKSRQQPQQQQLQQQQLQQAQGDFEVDEVSQIPGRNQLDALLAQREVEMQVGGGNSTRRDSW